MFINIYIYIYIYMMGGGVVLGYRCDLDILFIEAIILLIMVWYQEIDYTKFGPPNLRNSQHSMSLSG